MVVALHAVIVAGGHFVPVDVEAPSDRVRYVLETSGADIVLVGAGSTFAQPGVRTVTVDCSSPVGSAVDAVTDARRRGPLRAGNALYTIFTSGSTGRPKASR